MRQEKARKRKEWRDALRPLPGALDWYKVNAFAGIFLAAGFVVLKCFVIARGDVTTALEILQYVGLATVVVAGLLSSLPILAAATLAYTVVQWIGSLRARGLRWRPTVVMLGAFVLAAVLTPWTYLVIAAVIGLVIGLIRLWRGAKLMAVVYWLAALCALPLVIMNLYAVWLPHEIVAFRPGTTGLNGRTQEVGYVLSEDNGWITMLITGQGQEHKIIRVPDAAVKTQTVCEATGSWHSRIICHRCPHTMACDHRG